MKIALVRARYSPHGGAERFVSRAVNALADDEGAAMDVAVLARRWGEPADDPLRATVRLIRCDPYYLGSVWRDASFAAAVHRRLRQERFDLVQSHERIVGLPIYRAGDGVHAAWLERRSRASSASTRLAIALNPHHAYLTRVERSMFEHPALQTVICNSAMVEREIVERFAIDPAKLVVIRNGVDLDRFHPDAAPAHRATSRARLGVDRDAFVFVMVGSGFERKGVAAALQALRGCPGARLVIVGDDKHRDRYVREALRLDLAARVRFVGAVDDPLPLLAMADAALAPALYDPFPNAALEAMACGLPLITTDACGAAELIVDDVNGWVVPAADRDALEGAMRRATGLDASRVAAMRVAARAAAEPYSLVALSRSLQDLYRRLLRDRGTRFP